MKRIAMRLLAGLAACSRSPGQAAAPPAPPSIETKQVASTGGTADPLPPLPYRTALPETVRVVVHERFTGDLDGMVKRRLIRAAVTYNPTSYSVDNGVRRGATCDHLKNFEDRLNIELETGNLRVHVVCNPMSRDVMLTPLVNGQIDLAEAGAIFA